MKKTFFPPPASKCHTVQASRSIFQRELTHSRFTELQLTGLHIKRLVEMLRARGGVYGQRFYIDRPDLPGMPAVIVGWMDPLGLIGFED